ncbi:outer membrane beta-barrel protein [Desertivirga arenae]|uniref:outer membrane beta-barrel protein n=1 Tax=Desertivirga arenae TaxID=2810309 RepID=UPI001A9663E5|nr:outer membrane beta-barrel protein [Pedobacter sp. SYSU D00823]
MKKILSLCCLLLLTLALKAQLSHEVSGIVKDSTDNTVIAASVTLTSTKDTLKTVTNGDGIFIFKNVQAGQFVISVKSLGFSNFNKRFLYNDATKRLILDPIILKSSSNLLKEVTVNGTPSITYKEDTVEFRATDYKVRENATVDELLKKMEGVEVGTDGSVTFQGQAVTKARLNGKDYSGGDVANAIQNLPAEIIEKAQFVDDYGDQAARTGIKDGEPRKVLNLTTKANRSVGNIARINGGLGSNERLETGLWGQRMSGNRVLTASTGLSNTVIGVAGSGNGGFSGGGNNGGNQGNNGSGNRGNGSGNANSGNFSGGVSGTSGTNKTGNASFGYRDKINPKMDLNTGLSFRLNNNNSTSNSITETFIDSVNTIYTERNGANDRNGQSGNFNFDLEYDIDKFNYLRVQPNISYTYSLNGSNTINSQRSLRNRQISSGKNSTDNTAPTFGGSLLYQHIFAKKGRNFSVNVNYSNNSTEIETEQNTNLQFYDPRTNDDIAFKDSLIRRLIIRNSLTNSLRASATFSESLSNKSRMDFNAQTNRRAYDNRAFTDNTINGTPFRIDSLSNIFNYSFTETRLSLNYRFTEKKYNFSLGVTAIPTLLEGERKKASIDTGLRRTNFFLIPIARLEYQFSRQHRLSLNYTGNAQEPTFDQIQPVRDVSNINNPVVGNPNLKASFNHNINFAYNNYIANSRLNYSLNLTARFVENSVVANSTYYGDSTNFIYETTYTNVSGIRAYSGNYNISKSFADRKYSLRYNGTISNNHGITFSRADKRLDPDAVPLKITSNSWNFNQRLGLQINPAEAVEFNPNINFVYTKADYSISDRNTWNRRWAFNADGRVYLQKTTYLTFSASQNFTSGLSAALTSNPLVINTSIQKQFFKRKNGTLGLQVFDILKENSFTNLTVTANSRTQTQSNALSRYFMLNFRWAPSKWTGTPTRNGRQMMRRGDGSFY